MELRGFFLTEGGERLEFRGLASIEGVQTELAVTCVPQRVRRGRCKGQGELSLLLVG